MKDINLYDIVDFGRLDMNYNKVRVLQAKHNDLETKCIGSGKCCKVALRLPILECANIAFNLKKEYYLIMEGEGEEKAQAWMDNLVDRLKATFYDESYETTGKSENQCVFYNNGCTIYEFRPFVCRGYGVIFTVDGFCPRARLENGDVQLFTGEAVKNIVRDFVDIYKEFGERHKEINYAVFMPLGVLHFLVDNDVLADLKSKTHENFWNVTDEYQMAFIKSILEDIPMEDIIN